MKLRHLLVVALVGGFLSANTPSASADKEPPPRLRAKKHRTKAGKHRKDAKEHRMKMRGHKRRAKVMDKRADKLEAAGKPGRAAVMRKKAVRQGNKAHAERLRARKDRAKSIDDMLKAKKFKRKADIAALKRAKARAVRRSRTRRIRAAELRARARARGWGKIYAAGAPPKKRNPNANKVRKEYKKHARRVAWLNRIMALAVDAGDVKVLARAEKLLDKENKRHNKWLSKNLTAKAPDATSSVDGASPAAPTTEAKPAAATTEAKAQPAAQ